MEEKKKIFRPNYSSRALNGIKTLAGFCLELLPFPRNEPKIRISWESDKLDSKISMKIKISGGKIDENRLKSIMDDAESGSQIKIKGTEIPKRFRHEKAFSSFKSIEYQDAKWVQIEDLYNLKNAKSVKLGANNDFTNSEYNMLIENWLFKEWDMFEKLEIPRYKLVSLRLHHVLEDVEVVTVKRGGQYKYVFLAKNQEKRKNTVGIVYWKKGTFFMETMNPKDYCNLDQGQEAYDMLLEMKKEKENK
ncbi:hypothetical protein B9Z55_005107 [Caenorhabditis nigoni]|uniref:F-box associated domain-containing protein n=1 Tax=Caenorhabditis nigoni TaxID=1611254 RepID=A0A2G5UZH3_9PELO|nr:hypothetical protein B9Z55_005107 [Caenorhabditis nigoni]